MKIEDDKVDGLIAFQIDDPQGLPPMHLVHPRSPRRNDYVVNDRAW
jgi:hypothetical protein